MIGIVNLVLREGAISCSYAFLGICEAIFRGRGLFFCVELHISIYFTDIKSFLIWTTSSLLQEDQLHRYLRTHNCMKSPPPSPRTKLTISSKILFQTENFVYHIFFWIFLNVNLQTFKKKNF